MRFQHAIRIIDHSTLAVTIEDRTGTSIPPASTGIQPRRTTASHRHGPRHPRPDNLGQTATTGSHLGENRQENALNLPFWGQEDDYIRVGPRSVLG